MSRKTNICDRCEILPIKIGRLCGTCYSERYAVQREPKTPKKPKTAPKPRTTQITPTVGYDKVLFKAVPGSKLSKVMPVDNLTKPRLLDLLLTNIPEQIMGSATGGKVDIKAAEVWGYGAALHFYPDNMMTFKPLYETPWRWTCANPGVESYLKNFLVGDYDRVFENEWTVDRGWREADKTYWGNVRPSIRNVPSGPQPPWPTDVQN